VKLRRKAVDIVVEDDGSPARATQVAEHPDARGRRRARRRRPDAAERCVYARADLLAEILANAPIHWNEHGAPADGAPPAPTAPPTGPPHLLGERLISRGLIEREQLEHALAEQVASGKRLGTQLLELGALNERQLTEVLAEQLELPVADLRLISPEQKAIARFPEAVARSYDAIALRETPDGLEVALADPPNDETRAAMEAELGCPISVVLAPPTEILSAIDQAYLAIDGVEQQVRAFEDFASSRRRSEDDAQILVDENAPIVQVVTMLLTQAVRDRASDIHLEPQDGSMRVRFRIDGVLRDITSLPGSMSDALISRIKVMADMNIVERRRSQDGQIQTKIDGRPLDIRVATTATIWGEKGVLRLLDKTRNLRDLSQLGMNPATSAAFSELVRSPFGMVICAGPTGSGKTTTLYAALGEINNPERNITTIEDPVEYVLPSINQIQVNKQAGITFADGLKAILRQDPDVILIGEIRDVETARIAVQSALTGHFVLSSIHATDTATALQRFGDMGIEPFLITSSVVAIEAQRLVRRTCSSCRQPYEPTAAELAWFEKNAGRTKEQFWHGTGCNVCSHTGYVQRIGVYELMQVSDGIKELVMAGATYDELRAMAISEGMHTLRDEALRLIEEDVTTIAEAVRSVYVR
jgi:type IV pilus assembly protein PilB